MYLATRTTSKGKQIISFLKENPFYVVFALALTLSMISLLFIIINSGNQFNCDNVGRQVSIEWEEVNLRKGHSTSKEIITTLSKGTSVTLTGNSYEYAMGDELSTNSWTEVRLEDDTTGWVVTASLKWS